MCRTIATSATKTPIRLPSAIPAMPSLGKIEYPVRKSGPNKSASPIQTTEYLNGVRESPHPRSIIIRKMNTNRHGMTRHVIRRNTMAKSRDACGRRITSTSHGANVIPRTEMHVAEIAANATDEPAIFFTSSMLPRPTDWPIAMPDAAPTPMIIPIIMKKKTLVLTTATNAASPRTRLTQIAAQVPAIECRKLVISKGIENIRSAGTIGPSVRLRGALIHRARAAGGPV